MIIFTAAPSCLRRGLSRWLLHADPDCLPRLSAAYSNAADAQERATLSHQFSLVMDDLWLYSIWKRTMAGRLLEGQIVLRSLLAGNTYGRFDWLDIGASDGVTTAEMAGGLEAELGPGIVHTWLADLHLRLQRFSLGPLVEYRTADDAPVLVRMGVLGLRLPCSPRRGDFLSSLLARLYLCCGVVRSRLHNAVEVSLVNPRVRELRDIRQLEMSVFVTDPQLRNRFDLVRASNLLNPTVFSREQLVLALGNLHSYLRDEGLLLVSRNTRVADGEIECGAVWRRQRGRFRHLADIGPGCEIASLVETQQFH